MKGTFLTVLLITAYGAGVGLEAASVTPSSNLLFNRDIRPILSQNCFACHGRDSQHRKADLRLDTLAGATTDLGGYSAIVPGDRNSSKLFARISTTDVDDLMPPPDSGHELTPAQIETLGQWIDAGAPYARHWSFVKPERAAVPKVSDPSATGNSIDRFVRAELNRRDLEPSPVADAYTLIRRLHLDIVGLPPTINDADRFASNREANAYERLVDGLLASPAYGEHWGRMWLDLARYADSAGYGSDPLRMNIWPYRDWVIRAFNRNLPFDQFTVEQLAGDLVPDPSEDQLVATAFHRNTKTNTEGGTDDEEFRTEAIKDRINTTMQVWMGLTMGCATCHTHKYDPITNEEYYQFFAFFNQTEDSDRPDEYPTLPVPNDSQREKMAQLNLEIAALNRKLHSPFRQLEDELRNWEAAVTESVDWVVLEPLDMKGSEDVRFEKQQDGSILVSGESAEKSTYTIQARTTLGSPTAFRLEALSFTTADGPDRAEAGTVAISEFEVFTSPTEPARFEGRFVRVDAPGNERILSLAEVQLWNGTANMALGGTAKQSSTAFSGPAALAIDGNTDGHYANAMSTTHTQTEKDPWWEVDLGEEVEFDRVSIWNRTDAGLGSRLANLRVTILNAQRKPTWESTIGKAPSPSTEITPKNLKAIDLWHATTDVSEEEFTVANAIDDDEKTAWAFTPKKGGTRTAVFETRPGLNLESEKESRLTFVIKPLDGENQVLRRFRLSATVKAPPVNELPDSIASILEFEPGDRSTSQTAAVLEFFRPLSRVHAAVAAELQSKKKALASIKPVAVPVMRELTAKKRRQTHVLTLGNFLQKADPVKPVVPAAFHDLPETAPTDRLGVALWLTDEQNPLTARVTANRIWAQLFGYGLVETEEDFGTQGLYPSHPELLDWLAVELIESGWDIKSLIKTIVMSSTYRQSSKVTPELLAVDPRNRWLARGPRFRLKAEMVRDQALAVSGLLSHKMLGPSVYPPQPDGMWQAAFNGQRDYPTSVGEDRYRRGLYTFIRRTVPYPSMATFDAPSREICSIRRFRTNTPLQSFVTLNDPVYVAMAQSMALRIMTEGGESIEERARFGLRLCLLAPPSGEQVGTLLDLYDEELERYSSDPDAATAMATASIADLPSGINVGELAAWTVVANVLMNLDAFLVKG